MRVLLVILCWTATATADTEFPGLPALVAVKQVTATSTKRAKHDRYRALNVFASPGADEPSAAWCEGVAGAGVGEGLTITLAEPTALAKVRIAAGMFASDELYAANNQPTALEVVVDGTARTVSPRGRTWVEVPIGKPVTTLAIKIAAVRAGKHADTCLGAVELVAGAPLAPVVGVEPAALRALGPAMVEVQRAMSAPNRAGLTALVAFPFVYNSFVAAVENGPGGPVPRTYRTARALARACAHPADPPTCPAPAWQFDPAEPPGTLRPIAPGAVEFRFTKAEYAMTWRMVWKDRWRLAAELEL